MEYNFLNRNRKLYMSNLIKNKILPNLLQNEFDILLKYLFNIIEYISIRFAISAINYESFWHQLTQNNNRDILAFFNLLLPYIDDKDGTFDLHKQIYKLDDISLKKNPYMVNTIDESINKYLISNIQYNMFQESEIAYSLDNINKNFSLLLETIDRISNKLYVNWLNVIPFTLNNYTESNLFKSSIQLMYLNKFDYNIADISINSRIIKIKFNNLQLKKTFFCPSHKLTDIDASDNTLPDIYNLYRSDTSIDLIQEKLIQNKGISIGDIFNTIYYDLFYDVLHIKWLIYQSTFDNNDIDEIYIKIFNENIAIPQLYLNIKWNELQRKQQQIFISKWTSFLNKIPIINTPTNINSKGYFNLLYNIIIFMERNYNKINSIIKTYNYNRITLVTKFDVIDNDDVFNNREIDISPIELINRIKVLPIEDIYTYLLETIQKFMSTWYGKNIILDIKNTKNGITMNGLSEYKFNYDSYFEESIATNDLHKYGADFSDIDFPEILTIKYKFVYNFAKAFVLIYDQQQKEDKLNPYVRSMWYNMNQRDRVDMIKLLNKSYYEAMKENNENEDSDKLNLMSFRSYYKRIYSNTTKKYNNKYLFESGNTKYKKNIIDLGMYIGNQFYQHIRDKLVNITFECHIMKGLLGELIFNKNLTDKVILGDSFDTFKRNQYDNIKKHIFTSKNIKEYNENAYYYLTDRPYGELGEIHRNTKKNFFELLSSEYGWYSSYAMDWVAQINFFHHYINNRVIYITGATGQGKSTQIPKLFLYGLKMIDKKSNGRVICSQPRINATKNNTEQISWELGVPIIETSINYKQQVSTYNPYVQYQTQTNSHIIESNNGLLLKLVTDKLLSIELLKNPIFKQIEKSTDDNTTSETIEFNVYGKENIYDIIMVDESHEHNVNMDIILTIARDTINFNNSLKLVIISATMTDDEYIYRRYYKEINDNFTFPYNNYNMTLNFSRTSIDRRIHISPPGETTQHIINDIYLKSDPIDYKSAEKLAIEKVLNIISTTSSGDILLFSLSSNDIRNICIYVNKMLPASSNVICMPYFRELPPQWDIFDKLSDKVKLISVNREDLYNELYPSPDNMVRKVIPGTYSRVIIVATNIAEASITVNSLKYVIDTGYNIIVSDDIISMETIIEHKLISETSRIQRRGRVGRVGPGTVYYMYTKDSRSHIKSNYKICIQNIYSELYDLVPRIYNDVLLISHFNFMSHIYKKFDESAFNNILSRTDIIVKSKILLNLIIFQYTYLGYLLPSIINLISKKTHIDFLNLKNLTDSLKDSGYSFDYKETYDLVSNREIRRVSGYNIGTDIYDIYGDFYIIHPDENNIKRNLLTGKIIRKKSYESDIYIDTNYIISLKIYKYLKTCFSHTLFINHQIIADDSDIFYKNNIEKFSNIKFEYDKSIFGRITDNILRQFKLTDNDQTNRSLMMTIIYSYVCKLDHIAIIMICLLIHSDFSLKNLNPNIDIFKILYSNDDLYIYYSLALKIYENRNIFELDNFEYNKIRFESEKELYIKQKQIIKYNIKNKSNYWNIDIPLDIYKKFVVLDNQNKLNSEKNIFNYINEIAKSINPELGLKFYNLLKSLSLEIDLSKSIKILKSYIEIKNIIDKLKNNNKLPNTKNDLLWFDYYLPIRLDINEFENIKRAFIYGFGIYQTVIYDPATTLYFNINNLSKPYKISKYTLSSKNEILVYLFNNQLKNELSIIINSNFDTLIECNLYNYNPLFLENIKTTLNNNNIIFNNLVNKLMSIYTNRSKYINFLKVDKYIDPQLEKLFSYGNNFTEYLIKLWMHDITINTQFGGYNNIVKININKLPRLLKKSNIQYNYFLKFIKNKYYVKNNYLYIIFN